MGQRCLHAGVVPGGFEQLCVHLRDLDGALGPHPDQTYEFGSRRVTAVLMLLPLSIVLPVCGLASAGRM